MLVIAILNSAFPINAKAKTFAFSSSHENNPLAGLSVNQVTGDFSYSLPLMTIPGVIGGFPLNLSYNAGIGVEQEASWLGLGWNLYPGGINRNRKGFPDDWSSKKVENFSYKYPTVYHGSSVDGINYFPTSLLHEEQIAFGALYNAKAWKIDRFNTQDPNYVMDTHENPYSQEGPDEFSNAQNSTLSFPSYDDYELVSPDFVTKMSPKIFEFGTITGKGKIFANWEETAVYERRLPKFELAYSNRFKFTDRKVHFYLDGEHSSFGQIKPNHVKSIYYSEFEDVLWNPYFDVSSYNPYGEQTYKASENRIKTGNFVKWYSNFELYSYGHGLLDENSLPDNNGFLECDEIAKDRKSLSIDDPQGIGAFSVTTPEGKTYHYSLPVYQHEEFTYHQKITDPDNDLSINTNYNKYAYTWLLTAITGSDFIDKGDLGTIDLSDEGYWVKFEYGKWTEGYPWRNPYSGTNEIPSNYWYDDKTDYSNYSFGIKELYYLNSIQTASHTAFFIKSLRKDAQSQNQITYNSSVNHTGNESISLMPSERHQVLKLDKIILLNNEDAHLVNKENLNTHFLTSQIGQIIKNDLPYREFNIYLEKNVLDLKDIEANLTQIESEAVQIVDFNQTYELCSNKVNSPAIGKLTLKSIDHFNNKKIKTQPSFKFSYLKNPVNVSSYKDRWGFYSLKEDDQSKPDADAWSLNEILLPSGGKISVTYESDTYGEIETMNGGPFWGKIGGGIRVSEIKIDEGSNNTFSKYSYVNPNTNQSSGVISYRPNVSGFIPYVFELPPPCVRYEYVTVEEFGNDKSLLKKTQSKFDVRGKVLVKDIQHSPYAGVHQDKNADGEILHSFDIRLRASVVIDHSAALGRTLSSTTFNKLNQIIEKTIFEYYPISEIKAGIRQETFNQFKRFYKPWSIDHVKSDNYFITTLSSKVCYPNVLKKISKTSNGLTKIDEFGDLSFTNNGFDLLSGKPLVTRTYLSNKEYKTISVPCYNKIPYAKMGSKADDITNKNMLVQETATYVYAKEDLNFVPPSNVNPNHADLSQIEEYDLHSNQRIATQNTSMDDADLIKATVQTWKPNWNYRGLNSNKNSFVDSAYHTDQVWKPHQNFVWNSITNYDGTIKTKSGVKQRFTDFDWTGLNIKDNWKRVFDIKRIDKNANAIESSDIYGYSYSVKTDLNCRFPIAKCNANYGEFAFSGAEEIIANTNFFDGEVSGASNRFNAEKSPQFAHTGDFSIRLNTKSDGFKYTTLIGAENNQMKKGKKYKASVWLRSEVFSETAPKEATLTYRLWNADDLLESTSVNPLTTKVEKAGNWYLMTIDIEIPDSIPVNKIEIIASANAIPENPIYFDDFRVHPMSNPLLAYVYNRKLGLTSASLDGDNFGTKYIYDNKGVLIEEHHEFIDRNGIGGFIKIKENTHNYSRDVND